MGGWPWIPTSPDAGEQWCGEWKKRTAATAGTNG